MGAVLVPPRGGSLKTRRRSSPQVARSRRRPETAVRRTWTIACPRRRGFLIGLAGGLVLLLAVAGYFLWPASMQLPVAGDKDFPLPPLSSSPFLNTRSDARYVGSDTCRECHAGETASFRRTGMGRSMAVIDPASEPPNATFDHPLSQRR